jgi:cobalamin biosynthetic protein CobC
MIAPAHGGSLSRAERRWGRPADGWLDLSTGINPWPYPIPALDPEIWHRLPDESALARLLAQARRFYGTDDACPAAAAAGSQALIGMLPGLFAPRRVHVLAPTYAEHAYRWRQAGHDVEMVSELPEAAHDAVVIVTNPNNPDGRISTPERLLALSRRLAASGGLLIVDEAFADTDPAISLCRHAGDDGLVVLRSFGKFFGLAGLRLGVAFGPAALMCRITEAFGPWPLSGPALAIGTAAMADMEWAAGTRRRLAQAGTRFDTALGRLPWRVIGGTPLFRLVEAVHAAGIADRLGRAGILVRAFEDQPHWLRIGLPADSAAENRFIRTMHDMMERVS